MSGSRRTPLRCGRSRPAAGPYPKGDAPADEPKGGGTHDIDDAVRADDAAPL